LKKDYQILIIFGTNINATTGHQTTVQVLLLHYLGKNRTSEICVEMSKENVNKKNSRKWRTFRVCLQPADRALEAGLVLCTL